MTYEQLERLIKRTMPDHLALSVQPTTTPLYLRLQGKEEPLRYHPYILGVANGYATSSFGNYDLYETYDEALQAGMRRIVRYLKRDQYPIGN